jgi:hypothetical protein
MTGLKLLDDRSGTVEPAHQDLLWKSELLMMIEAFTRKSPSFKKEAMLGELHDSCAGIVTSTAGLYRRGSSTARST